MLSMIWKLFPRMLSVRWNSFRVCSVCDKILSAYAQHIFELCFQMVVISPYAEHTQKLVTCWLSIRGNWLPVGWACPLFLSHVSFPCLLFSFPCLTSLFPVSRLCSLFPALCSLSHVSVPCLPSSVPCLNSLFLVSRPLFPIIHFCSLSPFLFPQS